MLTLAESRFVRERVDSRKSIIATKQIIVLHRILSGLKSESTLDGIAEVVDSADSDVNEAIMNSSMEEHKDDRTD